MTAAEAKAERLEKALWEQVERCPTCGGTGFETIWIRSDGYSMACGVSCRTCREARELLRELA